MSLTPLQFPLLHRIVFRNEENGYSVLCMKEGNKEEFLVGVFPDVSEGEYLTARGEMNVHPIYGKQLRVQEYEFTAPSDAHQVQYPALFQFLDFCRNLIRCNRILYIQILKHLCNRQLCIVAYRGIHHLNVFRWIS